MEDNGVCGGASPRQNGADAPEHPTREDTRCSDDRAPGFSLRS
ncbi:hypothetical protein JFPO14_contig00003-0025 [Edwardsiella piscicida]|nr:hypothetical protein N4G58_05805 [Edwardsiella piscicida]GBK56831.1 hypothetical protein JFPO14_contig00003-0025 [Edwardsiella piscicida]